MCTHHQKRQPVIVAQVLAFFFEWRIGFKRGQLLIQCLSVFEASPLLTNDVQGDTLERGLVQADKNSGNGMFRR